MVNREIKFKLGQHVVIKANALEGKVAGVCTWLRQENTTYNVEYTLSTGEVVGGQWFVADELEQID